jgi:hypothetical protein
MLALYCGTALLSVFLFIMINRINQMLCIINLPVNKAKFRAVAVSGVY